MKKTISTIIALALIIITALTAMTLRIEPITETFADGDVAIFVDENGIEWAYTDYYADPSDEFSLLIFDPLTKENLHDDIILKIFVH
jgi:hypothetical protein